MRSTSIRTGLTIALGLVFIAHVSVFGFRSLVAERRIRSDAMNYIEVARNLSAGEGLVQSAVGFNQPTFWTSDFSTDFPHKTRSSHNVGYPILIAAVAEITSLEHADAALLLSVASYLATLAFAFLFASRVWGVDAGLFAAAIVALLTRWFFLRVWAGTVAVALLLAMLAVLAKGVTPRRSAAAGVLAGLAVTVRSGMAPILVLGGLASLLARNNRLLQLGLFCTGAGFGLAGLFAGEGQAYPPHLTSDASWFAAPSPGALVTSFLLQMREELGALVVLGGIAWWRARREGAPLVPPAARLGCLLAAAWIAGFSTFLVAARVVVLTDMWNPFDDRLMAPVLAVLCVGYGGLLWRALGGRWRHPTAVALFVLSMIWCTAADAGVLATGPYRSDMWRINRSPLLFWVGSHVDSRDLVVGTDVTEVPYYFRHAPVTVSLTYYPYFQRVSGARIDALFRARCGRFDDMYLLLRKNGRDYGGFVRGLLSGRPGGPGSPRAGFQRVADLADGMVFRFVSCESSLTGTASPSVSVDAAANPNPVVAADRRSRGRATSTRQHALPFTAPNLDGAIRRRYSRLSVTIQLNGEAFEAPGPLSVSRLLATLDIDPRRVAVEHNRLVVRKAAYDSTVVAPGDEIEVVNFVGGG